MTKPEYQLHVREEIYLDNMLDLFSHGDGVFDFYCPFRTKNEHKKTCPSGFLDILFLFSFAFLSQTSPNRPAHTDCHDNTAVLLSVYNFFLSARCASSVWYSNRFSTPSSSASWHASLLYYDASHKAWIYPPHRTGRMPHEATSHCPSHVIIHLIVRLVTTRVNFLPLIAAWWIGLFRLLSNQCRRMSQDIENRSAVSVFHDIKLDSLPICLQTFCWIVIFAVPESSLPAPHGNAVLHIFLVHSLSDHFPWMNSKHVVYMLVCNEISWISFMSIPVFNTFQNTVATAPSTKCFPSSLIA